MISRIYTRLFSVFATTLYKPLLFITRDVKKKISADIYDIDLSKPVVIICNHQTTADFLAIFSVLSFKMLWKLSPVKFMTWHRIYYSVALPILYSTGCFPTHRSKHSGVKGAVHYARNNYRVLICPEGSRIKDGMRKPAYKGVSQILEQLDNPAVILVYIDWESQPHKHFRPPTKIVWRIAPENLDTTNPDKIMDEVYKLADTI